jgi:SAM-dependent methyltransferase
VTDPARIGYAAAAEAWATQAELAYGPLARHLIDACPIALDGSSVLDAGAGTGAATGVLRDRGAWVVAVDLQDDMLRRTGTGVGRAVGDVTALPFRPRAFDVVIAAFVLNHLTCAADGLRQMRDVCRPGGAVLASSFSSGRAIAKSAVDAVAFAYGWVKPDWYNEIRSRADSVSTTEHLIDAARSAGLQDIAVTDTEVDLGLDDPELVTRYRLGMPQLADFERTLPVERRAKFRHDAIAAVAETGERFRPSVIELVARVN